MKIGLLRIENLFMIIYLFGPDGFRINQKLRDLKNKFKREIDKSGINIAELAGNNLTVENFHNAVFAQSFLVKKRMIVAKEVLKSKKDVQEGILEIIKGKNLPKEVIIIFLDNTEANQGKGKWAKQPKSLLFDFLKKQQYAYDFPFLAGPQLTTWIKREMVKRGGKVDSQAIEKLAVAVGNDLWQMTNEIDKLIALTDGGRRAIGARDVALLVKAKIDDNIFNLVDALGARNKKQALKLLTDQMKEGAEPQYLFTMITRQFRILLQIKDFIESKKGWSYQDAARQLSLHPFVARKAMVQAKNFTLAELKKIYSSLQEVDIGLKTSKASPEVLLNLFLLT